MSLHQGRYLAIRLPVPERPPWFPPFELRAAADLHSEILRFCAAQRDVEPQVEPQWENFNWLVTTIWRSRLPLEEVELAAILRAHGAADEITAQLAWFFSRGRELLVVASGRRPVKNKRADYVRRTKKGARRK